MDIDLTVYTDGLSNGASDDGDSFGGTTDCADVSSHDRDFTGDAFNEADIHTADQDIVRGADDVLDHRAIGWRRLGSANHSEEAIDAGDGSYFRRIDVHGSVRRLNDIELVSDDGIVAVDAAHSADRHRVQIRAAIDAADIVDRTTHGFDTAMDAHELGHLFGRGD